MPDLDPATLDAVKPWSEVSQALEAFYLRRVAKLATKENKRALAAEKFGIKEDSFRRALQRHKIDDTGW